MDADVLIVGAGLSGLHTAYECEKNGIDYLLMEARDRFGGRIHSKHLINGNNHLTKAAFDLGPSWFWPGQSSMHALLAELQLADQVIQQYGKGDALFEDNERNVRRGVEGISMAGAYRLKAGIGQLIEALRQTLSSNRYHCSAVVNSVEFKNDSITTTALIDGKETCIKSRYLVLAMPPRVALASIQFNPSFSQTRTSELTNIATWMAGHAKLCAVYPQPFWREQGYSGDVISHSGPLQEIHDASSDDAELNALFGFVNIPAQHRKGHEDEIKALALTQFARLFGESALQPIEVYLKDWALDSYTATKQDQEIQRFHPVNDIRNVRESSWNEQLIWSGSESASPHSGNNGFLEGALEASLRTSAYLNEQLLKG